MNHMYIKRSDGVIFGYSDILAKQIREGILENLEIVEEKEGIHEEVTLDMEDEEIEIAQEDLVIDETPKPKKRRIKDDIPAID